MTLYGWLISASWLALILYWVVSAGTLERRPADRWLWWREIAVRLGFFAAVVLALQVAATPNATRYTADTGVLLGWLGVALCSSGVALAILARVHLDRSRRMAGSNRTTPELVMTGPYAIVRHPLYGGLLLAMAGSAIAQSLLWLLPLAVYAPLLILSARREERFLLEQFSDRYAAYMRRRKMLLPFVF